MAKNTRYDQTTLDMAEQWVAETHPDLEGPEFDLAVLEAAADILDCEESFGNGYSRHAF